MKISKREHILKIGYCFFLFYRDWSSYKLGFWDRTGEFWLGNEILHNLTSESGGSSGGGVERGGEGADRGGEGGGGRRIVQPESWDLMIKMKWRSDLTGYYPGGAFAQQVFRDSLVSAQCALDIETFFHLIDSEFLPVCHMIIQKTDRRTDGRTDKDT